MLHRHEISALCSGVSVCTAHPTVSSPLSEQQSTQNHTEKEIRPCLQQLFCWLLCSDEWFILICLIALLPSPFTEKLGAALVHFPTRSESNDAGG